jgi:hypothetical protein
MNSPPFPEIPCVICSKPVNLQTDLCADENGKAVHADCCGCRPFAILPFLPDVMRLFRSACRDDVADLSRYR